MVLANLHTGTALEPECKTFRFLADIFNDVAMVLDCLSPAFPKFPRVFVLGGSSILRALCGVAAGSSKASLSAHFARAHNLAELNAKDSSQETVISLLGMAAGSVVVTWVTTPFATWSALILLLAVHLGMNHAAVRAVTMCTLNRQRATIVFSHLVAYDTVLDPRQVSVKERIFERDGVIRDAQDKILGRCRIGVSLSRSFEGSTGTTTTGQSILCPVNEIVDLFSLFEKEKYVLRTMGHPANITHILLKNGCGPRDQLKAWCTAILAFHATRSGQRGDSKREMSDSLWTVIEQKLSDAGWDLDTGALETRPGLRVSVAV